MAHAWVFDVDGCLIDSFRGTSLRPLASEILSHLAQSDDQVVVWSAGGSDYARERLRRLGVDGFVDRFEEKEGRDEAGRYLTACLGTEYERLIFIDDRPEDMPVGADVLAVAPYLIENPRDRGLRLVADRLGLPETP